MSAETTWDGNGAAPLDHCSTFLFVHTPRRLEIWRCEWFTPASPSFSLAVTLFGSTTRGGVPFRPMMRPGAVSSATRLCGAPGTRYVSMRGLIGSRRVPPT